MTTWVALLRGVNVGGNNKLPMAELRAMLSKLGYGHVASYIQSGNAVFTSDHARNELAGQIATGIEAEFGFHPRVLLLTLAELEGAIERNPYLQARDDPKSLHLIFLGSRVEAFDRAGLLEFVTNGEEVQLDNENNVFYLYTPNGYGRSKVAEKLDRFLKVSMTARNLRSCHKIAELAASCGSSAINSK